MKQPQFLEKFIEELNEFNHKRWVEPLLDMEVNENGR
jgi:hypothetical protein